MNLSFKLGKVSVPVTADKNVEVQDIEISVTDYNLKEGLEIAKAVPGILHQLNQVKLESIHMAHHLEHHLEEEEEEEELEDGQPLGDLTDFLTAAIAAKEAGKTSPEEFFASLQEEQKGPSLGDVIKAAIEEKLKEDGPATSSLFGFGSDKGPSLVEMLKQKGSFGVPGPNGSLIMFTKKDK